MFAFDYNILSVDLSQGFRQCEGSGGPSSVLGLNNSFCSQCYPWAFFLLTLPDIFINYDS